MKNIFNVTDKIKNEINLLESEGKTAKDISNILGIPLVPVLMFLQKNNDNNDNNDYDEKNIIETKQYNKIISLFLKKNN